MAIRIALIAPPGLYQQKLRSELSRRLSFTVHEFQSLDGVCSGLAQYPFEVLITRLAQFDLMHVATIEKLAAVFPRVGLITISPQINPQARLAVRHVPRHSLLDENLERSDLDRVAVKAANPREKGVVRMHPRAKRQDEAVLVTTDEAYDLDTLYDVRFRDFARMGARLSVPPEVAAKLQPKTRIEVRYRSSEDRNTVHRLEARVVWIKKASALDFVLAGSRCSVGVQFVAEL